MFWKYSEEAFLKSSIASGVKLPKSGDSILISVGGDKERILNMVKTISENGFKIFATEHTAEALTKNNIECERLYKVSENKKPNIIDFLVNQQLKFVINIPSPDHINLKKQSITDGYLIRRKAVEFGIPLITNLELARILVNAMERHNNVLGF